MSIADQQVAVVRSALAGVNLATRTMDFARLAKPGLTALAVVATFFGYWMGAAGDLHPGALVGTLIGAVMIGAGANALNQYLEAEHDARMSRTAGRPLPSGRLTGSEVLSFSVVMFVVGVVYLALQANLLAALLATIAWVSYGFVYTPLKRKTTYCVHIGAIPGALPPVIGWAAGAGSLSIGAAMLFGVLLVWQLPHFASIAWLYREDYERGGFKIISVRDADGQKTSRHMLVYSLILLAVSLLPAIYGSSSYLYGVGAALLGLAYLATGVWFRLCRTKEIARLSLLASVTYLPCLFILMMIDKAFHT
ncbi:MAG: protoheme IX farnesyltransferase [Planctomycetes bacterium]|nr:protoheme IX farnesyltransferase [Planctomycetota bacterium]